MNLVDSVKSCGNGHAPVKAYLVYHNMNGSFRCNCYCPDCQAPFTREASPEEIAEFRRIQSIPLTEYRQ